MTDSINNMLGLLVVLFALGDAGLLLWLVLPERSCNVSSPTVPASVTTAPTPWDAQAQALVSALTQRSQDVQTQAQTASQVAQVQQQLVAVQQTDQQVQNAIANDNAAVHNASVALIGAIQTASAPAVPATPSPAPAAQTPPPATS